MKKLTTIILIFVAISCSDIVPQIEQINEVHTVSASIEDIESSLETRATINSELKFLWDDTDEVGIFPSLGGYQLGFSMQGQGGQANAIFNGGGWAMRADASYSSYYPFNFNLRNALAIPVNFSGQVQNGNGSTSHLGAFTYAATLPCQAIDGVINFPFKRLSSIICFSITVPDAGTYDKISLVSDANVFTLNGDYDMHKAKTDNDLVIKATKKSNSIDLNLSSITAPSNNFTINAYLSCAPFDATGHPLSVRIRKKDGSLYQASLTSINPVLTRNRVKTIAAKVEYTSSIGGWGEGDIIGGGI